MSIQIICTSQFKTTPPPRAYPRHLTGNLTQNVPPPHPSQAFDFHAKTLVSITSKGFSLFWLCLVGYLHLNKQFDAWENFWIMGEGFDTFWNTSWYVWGMRIWPSKNAREFHQNFGKKVKCPGGCLAGVGCVMGSFRIDWFIKLAKLQILKKFTFPFGKS